MDDFEPPKYLASLIAAINDGAKSAQTWASVGRVRVEDKQPFIAVGMSDNRLIVDPIEYWNRLTDWMFANPSTLHGDNSSVGQQIIHRFVDEFEEPGPPPAAAIASIACHYLAAAKAGTLDLSDDFTFTRTLVMKIAGTCPN